MPTEDAKACVGCGLAEGLLQCSVCVKRLSGRGAKNAICQTCAKDDRTKEVAGIIEERNGQNCFVCSQCGVFERHSREDELLHAVGGPSQEQILRTLASSTPWFLTIARATPEEKLAAHQKLKRKTDIATSSRVLADSLSQDDPTAALLFQNYTQRANDPLAQRAMDAFVTIRSPAVKYKSLLLPEFGGSLDKARRHFDDLKASPDPLVSALASERAFLCTFIERQCTPCRKRSDKPKSGPNEMPLQGLMWLRFVFKSMSIRIKKAAARDEAGVMLVRAWYADHLTIANAMMLESVRRSGQSQASHNIPTFGGNPNRNAPKRNADSAELDVKPPQNKQKGNVSEHVTVSKDGGAVRVPRQIAELLSDNLSKESASNAFRRAKSLDNQSTWAFFGTFCKNCFFGGKGLMHHRLSDCRKSSACHIICQKCNDGSKHWAEDCPKNKK